MELSPHHPTLSAVPGSGSGRTVNIARYDLVSLRLVLLCAEHGSLTGAAKHAHMSLSQASYRLSTLEHNLGVPFFRRSPVGLDLTDAGSQVVKCGHEILQAIEQLSRLLSQPPKADSSSGALPS